MLKTKPILAMNNIGKLEIRSKAIGTKKAIKALANKLIEANIDNTEDNLIYIAHSHCIDNALVLKNLVQKQFDKVTVKIKNLGPIIGSHTGPGALVILFLGKEKLKEKK